MTLILDGRAARSHYAARLKERVNKLRRLPMLAIIQIGDRKESGAYIEQKMKFGRELGIMVRQFKLSDRVGEGEVVDIINDFNEREEIDGIIVQLPIPPSLSTQRIIDSIRPDKDVDGLTTKNTEARRRGKNGVVIPATARGVRELLQFYKIEVKGKKVAVLGRSKLTGAPIAEAMEKGGAKVTVCHSHTEDEEEITKKSDIVVVAIGKPKFLNERFLRADKSQVVVDVGINTIEDSREFGKKMLEEMSGKRFVGDVDFESVADKVKAISPVPGGVGQMTVLGLFENLIDCAERRYIPR